MLTCVHESLACPAEYNCLLHASNFEQLCDGIQRNCCCLLHSAQQDMPHAQLAAGTCTMQGWRLCKFSK
jgi:hypothetical protein